MKKGCIRIGQEQFNFLSLPAREANHNTEFSSSCLLAEPAIHTITKDVAAEGTPG